MLFNLYSKALQEAHLHFNFVVHIYIKRKEKSFEKVPVRVIPQKFSMCHDCSLSLSSLHGVILKQEQLYL